MSILTSRVTNVVRIRAGGAPDLGFLEEMLFEAFFWDATTTRPVFATFRKHPEFTRLLADWGRPGDRSIVAEYEHARLGAAWFRLWTLDVHSYGFVENGIPEIGIAVAPGYRSKGVGRALLRALIAVARADWFPGLSLSVSPGNPARRLYESEGFRKVGKSGTSWTLLLPFD
jgi:ribosomal protein S18 acetylase RimI-like enzyme